MNEQSEMINAKQAEAVDAEAYSCEHNIDNNHDGQICGCVCPNYYHNKCHCYVSQECRDYYAAQSKFACGGALDCANETCGCDVSKESCRFLREYYDNLREDALDMAAEDFESMEYDRSYLENPGSYMKSLMQCAP